MVSLTFPIAAMVAIIASLASTSSAGPSECLRMYERFHLQSVSHGTYLVMDQATTNLMTGPGPLEELPLVMCVTISTASPCSDNPPSSCVPFNTGGLVFRVEFPEGGGFGFLMTAPGRRTIQVLPPPVRPLPFALIGDSRGGGPVWIASIVPGYKVFQAGSDESGAPTPIVLQPRANIDSQRFNIVKLP
ncbi:MAG: hypothetical protein J3Q66DRAFT_386343 [Benniella sp.]|nr:MAG: hypothetical protein J3Q66DRAFT_386343 [Benniella sp.]